ncbi:hypothetical protein [Micromonospora sp. WMMC415]|uniref:hypothetical protein n=1 Tax=Micromonospora sp. WMMC415 TaxID=2675222 RepID=UPI001E432782|nr:hypothetical protein [Micromonospora sp. WMMC415]
MTTTGDRAAAPVSTVSGAAAPVVTVGDAAADVAGPDPAGPERSARGTGRAGRYAAAGLVLGLVLMIGFAVGRAGRPDPVPVRAAAPPAHAGHGPGGLEVSRDGWTLALAEASLTAGRPGELAFRIIGPDGTAVTAFEVVHERRMHLIVIGRDLDGYQHVHPEMAPDGTWRARVVPAAAGPLRVIADFRPQGAPGPVALGVDVPVPGRYASRPLAPPEETLLVDGYTVTLDGGLRAGESNQVLVWLGRDGKPVGDLQRHLGAYGHLVALRQGDLAYLHVHPAAASRPSSVVAFGVTVPSAGTYRLFFEFRHLDRVHVAAFTVIV